MKIVEELVDNLKKTVLIGPELCKVSCKINVEESEIAPQHILNIGCQLELYFQLVKLKLK